MGLPVPEQDTARMLLPGGRRLESVYQERIRTLSLVSSCGDWALILALPQ